MTDSNTMKTPYDDAYEPFEGGFAFEQSPYRPQVAGTYPGCTDFAPQPNDQVPY